MRSGIVSLAYLVVGVVIASSHRYFEHASTLKPLLSAAEVAETLKLNQQTIRN